MKYYRCYDKEGYEFENMGLLLQPENEFVRKKTFMIPDDCPYRLEQIISEDQTETEGEK